MKRIAAIDPGALGGFAWITEDDTIGACSMPKTDGDVLSICRQIAATRPEIVLIEKVGGYIGGEGSPGSAMFHFGDGAGFLRGALMMAGCRIEMVTPQKWQKVFGFGKPLTKPNKNGKTVKDKTEWKNRLKSRAQHLFPSVDVVLGTADALLILEYGRRGMP